MSNMEQDTLMTTSTSSSAPQPYCVREDYFPSSSLWPFQSVGSRLNPCSHVEQYSCGLVNTAQDHTHQHHDKNYVQSITTRHDNMTHVMGPTMLITDVDSAWLPFTIELDNDAKLHASTATTTGTSTQSSTQTSTQTSNQTSTCICNTDTARSSCPMSWPIVYVARVLGCSLDGLRYVNDISQRSILFWDDIGGQDGDAISDWYEPSSITCLRAASELLRGLVDPHTLFDIRFDPVRYPQHPVVIGGVTKDLQHIQGWWATARINKPHQVLQQKRYDRPPEDDD